MVSCTEFIPLYSELFKFLDKKGGSQEVLNYWNFVSDKYVEPRLGEEVKKHGLIGCFNYWNKSLNEEACDFSITYHESEQYFEIDMKKCPSKSMLNELSYTQPYKNYCMHCAVLYSRVLEKYGIENTVCDFSNCDQATCYLRYDALKKDEK
ncbi:MAG: hypothetical protein E7358_02145 [Clostridiales bacterium]|nr:hypothetical protein [Clostridiales bacterium]